MSEHSLAERFKRIHRPGQDCRITSTRNMLELYGHRLSYATVQGLASSFYFSYRKEFSAADLLVFPGGNICEYYWPISGQRLEVFENIAYLFNAELLTGADQTPEAAEQTLLEFLREGVPVMVAVARFALAEYFEQVLRFPPYLRDLRFAGHFITVVGVDLVRRIAKILDTDHSQLLEIPLSVLARVRVEGDHEQNYFMRSRNRWVVLLPSSSQPPLKQMMRSALGRTLHLLLATQAGAVSGVTGLRKFCQELPHWVEDSTLTQDKLKATVFVMRMASDKLAGGSVGRRSFGMFLRQAGESLGSKALVDAAHHYGDLTALWQRLLSAVEAKVFVGNAPETLNVPELHDLLSQILTLEMRGVEQLQIGYGALQ
jgi:Domain of unknown function (DUF4872)/Butirosin biosynthesis protein H, N-terminal